MDGDARAHCIAVRFCAYQLNLQPVAVYSYTILEQRVAVGGGRDGNVHDAPVPEIRYGHSPAVEQQIRTRGISGFSESAILIAAQIAVALPAMPGGRAKIFRIEKSAGLVDILVGDYIVEELQFNLCSFIVVDPAIGCINVLPAIIVKITKHRAPEPSWWIRVSFDGDVFKCSIAFVAQQGVAGRH